MSLKWFCELVHMSLEFFCVPFLAILLWWWILLSVLNIVYTNEIWCLKDLFLSISSSMKQMDIYCGSEWQQITWPLFASVFCAGWPFRWISLILTACPWWTMMHCDWLQYASRKRRDSRFREVSSTARWTSTGPSYPLLKPAVLITLSLTLSSWHYSETENTRVIWVAQLNKSSVFKEVELRQYPNHGKITEIQSCPTHAHWKFMLLSTFLLNTREVPIHMNHCSFQLKWTLEAVKLWQLLFSMIYSTRVFD